MLKLLKAKKAEDLQAQNGIRAGHSLGVEHLPTFCGALDATLNVGRGKKELTALPPLHLHPHPQPHTRHFVCCFSVRVPLPTASCQGHLEHPCPHPSFCSSSVDSQHHDRDDRAPSIFPLRDVVKHTPLLSVAWELPNLSPCSLLPLSEWLF